MPGWGLCVTDNFARLTLCLAGVSRSHTERGIESSSDPHVSQRAALSRLLLDMWHLESVRVHRQGKRVALSGSGNVATYAVEKLLELGAVPVTVSDSTGYIYFEVRKPGSRPTWPGQPHHHTASDMPMSLLSMPSKRASPMGGCIESSAWMLVPASSLQDGRAGKLERWHIEI